MSARHLPEPSAWPTVLRRRRRPAPVSSAVLRRWRAAGLDPRAVVVVLKGGAA